MGTFPVYNLSDLKLLMKEEMGTKARDWCVVPQKTAPAGLQPGQQWLYKEPTRFRNERWSEKVAFEIGKAMGLPVAQVELASKDASADEPITGTICRHAAHAAPFLNVTPLEIEFGNVIVEDVLRQDPKRYTLHQREETAPLDAVFDMFKAESVRAPIECGDTRDGAFYFAGYLVFDAFIGNVDRHHENWGIVRQNGTSYLAPSFDHGASLGRELGAKKIGNYLSSAQIPAYLFNKKGVAKIAEPGSGASVAPLELVAHLVALGHRDALEFWVDRVQSVDRSSVESIFGQLPPGLISAPSRRFALEMSDVTRAKLAELI